MVALMDPSLQSWGLLLVFAVLLLLRHHYLKLSNYYELVFFGSCGWALMVGMLLIFFLAQRLRVNAVVDCCEGMTAAGQFYNTMGGVNKRSSWQGLWRALEEKLDALQNRKTEMGDKFHNIHSESGSGWQDTEGSADKQAEGSDQQTEGSADSSGGGKPPPFLRQQTTEKISDGMMVPGDSGRRRKVMELSRGGMGGMGDTAKASAQVSGGTTLPLGADLEYEAGLYSLQTRARTWEMRQRVKHKTKGSWMDWVIECCRLQGESDGIAVESAPAEPADATPEDPTTAASPLSPPGVDLATEVNAGKKSAKVAPSDDDDSTRSEGTNTSLPPLKNKEKNFLSKRGLTGLMLTGSQKGGINKTGPKRGLTGTLLTGRSSAVQARRNSLQVIDSTRNVATGKVTTTIGKAGHLRVRESNENASAPAAASEPVKTGDKVRIVKQGAFDGRIAVVVDPEWNGMVKVTIDSQTKSYKREHMVVVESDAACGSESKERAKGGCDEANTATEDELDDTNYANLAPEKLLQLLIEESESLSFLKELDTEQRMELSKQLIPLTFEDGDLLIREGVCTILPYTILVHYADR
jgi:hypothetical protein